MVSTDVSSEHPLAPATDVTKKDTSRELASLLDVPILQSMMDDFYALTQIPSAVIDLDGNVLVGAGWQDVCVGFHRVNPETCAFCIQSDTVLTADIPAGESLLYRCKNGMWDAAMPIVAGGVRVGNVFTGQFFFDDEMIDVEFFRQQAARYGFDEHAYLAAVNSVSRLSRSTVETGLDFLTRLTGVISQLSLNNAQIERQLELQTRRIARMTTLQNLSALVTSTLDVDSVIASGLEQVTALLGVAAASLWMFDDAAQRLRLLGARGFGDLFFDDFASGLPLDAPHDVVKAFRTGELVVHEHASSPDVAVPVMEAYARYEIQLGSLIALPLRSPSGVVGGLTLAWGEPRPFTDEDRAFGLLLADTFAIALENARLFKERTKQAELAEALNRINCVVHASFDVDTIVERMVVEITSALEVDAAAVHMHVDDSWRFTYGYGLPPGLQELHMSDSEARLSMHVLETRRPLVANDVRHDDRSNVGLMERFGITALVAVPLITLDEVVGVLFAGCLGSSASFTEAQVDFMSKAATTLALAMENARLYSIEQYTADRLQSALLAMPHTIPGIELAYAYHSATDTTRVGGDFYDVFELDEQRVGLTIGDVAGKGIDAAVITSLAKNTIRAHAAEGDKSPCRVLELTNRVVHQATPVESFVTVLFGILNRRDGTFVYANGGHTTCLVLRGDGGVSTLSPTGSIIGAYSSLLIEDAEICLDKGDLLFLFTDGLTEARIDQLEVAEERLIEFLGSYRGASADDVVTDVIDYVMSLTGCRLRDDLAILAARLLESGVPEDEMGGSATSSG